MPDRINPRDFGFPDRQAVASATAGMLAHLARIGLTHLPAAEKTASGAMALAIDVPTTPDSKIASSGSAVSSPGAVSHAPIEPPREASGGRQAVRAPTVSQPTSTVPRGRLSPAPAIEDGPTRYLGPSLPLADRQSALAASASEVSGCTRCPELVRSRRQTIFGEGSATPRVCFFGEAPGADEDRSGRPFVGRAGQLLTKMIEACTFSRDEVYILNTVKCRPPGNRNPQLEEVENCRGYFEHQLEVLQPEYIVCLGVVAARALLNTTASVGRLRGLFHRYRGSKVLVTYHPAYLLRNPEAKRAAWEDLQVMLRDMGIDPKKPRPQ